MVPPQSGIPAMPNMENIPKPKPALPEQHIHLQTVLDELRNQCHNKTANPVSFEISAYFKLSHVRNFNNFLKISSK